MKPEECKHDWKCEKRSRNGYWYFCFICEKCGEERLPTMKEREAFNE